MRAESALAAVLVLLLADPVGSAAPGTSPAAAAAAGAPSSDGSAAGATPLRVAVSVPPQAWLVERIGGSHVQVTTMLSAGGSEHAVELRPRQLAALERAHVYVKVGHPAFLLESQRIVPLLRPRPDVLIVDMAQGVPGAAVQDHSPAEGVTRAAPAETPEHGHAHGHGGEDPHLWLAPSVMRAAAATVARGLQQADPAHAAEYARNQGELERELDRIDAQIRALLGEATSVQSRRFLVYHPAWGYFAREYGLEQVAIEEEGKEPSPLRLIQLIERARALRVDTVFVQRGMSTRSAKVVAREIGARVAELDPMARDWKAAMLHAAREIGASLRTAPGAAPPQRDGAR